MYEVRHRNLPVLVSGRERIPGRRRVRPKVRKIVDFGIRKLNPRQKEALANYLEMGCKNKKLAATMAGYSPNNAINDMNRILSRKPIVDALKKRGVTDDKIAEVIAQGLQAKHPFKPKKKDFHAIDKFVKEANRLLNNYPPVKIESQEKVVHIHLTMDDFAAYESYKKLRAEKEANKLLDNYPRQKD